MAGQPTCATGPPSTGLRRRSRRARADRDPRHQRRRLRIRAIRGHHPRRLGPDYRGEPHRNVQLPAGGHRRHGGGGLGPDRDHLLGGGTDRFTAPGALLGLEGRRDRPDQDRCPRVRREGHHREHDPAVRRRHADAPRRAGVDILPSAEVLAGMVPAGRLGTGDDIAAVCAFLCSDDASYVTGQVIAVNGGAVT